MEERKQRLLKAIGKKELAIEASTSESAIYRALKGISPPSDVIAERLARAANKLCAHWGFDQCYESTDFNPKQVLPEDALFIVQDHYFGTMFITARRLIDKQQKEKDRDELESLLRELYHSDATNQVTWNTYTIQLHRSEEN
jgi:hypothetical protein